MAARITDDKPVCNQLYKLFSQQHTEAPVKVMKTKAQKIYLWGEEREKEKGIASRGSGLQAAPAGLGDSQGLCRLEGFKEWKDHENKKGRCGYT